MSRTDTAAPRTALRRALAVLTATALAFVMLPVMVASAAVAGAANLTSATALFPTASAPFSFTVTNSSPALVGESMNWVRFVLPSDEAGIVHNGGAPTAPTGWTATRDGGADEVQTVTFRATQGAAAIRPGGSASFSFPAEVKRPLNSDRPGTFTVAGSSDSGRTTTGLGGALTTTVKILDILDATTGVVAPPGAADGSGTAGQEVDFAYQVINYAQQEVQVSGTVLSDGADTVVPATRTLPVPGNGTAAVGNEKPVSFPHDVTLGPAASNRTSTFTVKAAIGSATSPAQDATRAYAVQARSVLALTDLQPARTKSSDSTQVSFSALATKTGTPALDITNGTLSFADFSTSLTVANDVADFGTGPSSKRVTFAAKALNTAQLAAIVDAEKEFSPVVTASATDGNDFQNALTGNLLDAKVLIDNLTPRLTVDVALPQGQSAVKNGDLLTVSGTIAAADVVPAGNLKVALDPDLGDDVPVNVTATKLADGTFTFTGTVRPAFLKATNADGSDDRAGSAKSFTAKAEVRDIAGNLGNGSTNTANPFVIDNFLPTLLDPGSTTSTRTIAVQFQDLDLGITTGGCDPRHYRVAGVPGTVSEVQYSNGAVCRIGEPAPSTSGQRILVLRNEMPDDATPTVTYEPVSRSLGGDPVRDGAFNETIRTTIDTVRQIVPLAPEIVEVTRDGGTEQATRDEVDGRTTYFTRFPGSLVKTEAEYEKNDLVVSFLGAKNGYSIEVLDGQGASLAVLPVTGPATPLSSGEQSVRIPIGTLDTTYARSIRFITTNASNETLRGDLSSFDVVLDRTAPRVVGTQVTGKTVAVSFDDVIHSGTDFAGDWFGLSRTSSGANRAYTSETVTPDQTGKVRTLSVPVPDGMSITGVEYRFTSGPDGGQRYLDRAGNEIANLKA